MKKKKFRKKTYSNIFTNNVKMYAFGTELGRLLNSQTFLKPSELIPPYGTGNLLDENFHKTCCKISKRTQKFLSNNTIIWPRQSSNNFMSTINAQFIKQLNLRHSRHKNNPTIFNIISSQKSFHFVQHLGKTTSAEHRAYNFVIFN